MATFQALKNLLIVLLCSGLAVSWSNDGCLAQLQAGDFGEVGLNSSGQPVPYQNATTIPYEVCLKCVDGHGQEPFQWGVFSSQFSSWLLPWLALISQLPFGATYRLDNIVAMVLTVGSPVLAAYSLILTVLNGYYVARRFSGMTYPNTFYAARIMAGLQQSPLRLSKHNGLLASLIVLPDNDRWWPLMNKLIEYQHTWTISAFASIAWVVVAYILTVVDSFADITSAINANGQGVGCLWLWLLPIVIGWLQISPKCDAARLEEALQEANRIAHVALENGNIVSTDATNSRVGKRRAFTFIERHSLPSPDEGCTSPIFNYARVLSWSKSVEKLAEMFYYASEYAEHRIPVNQKVDHWLPGNDGKIHRCNRIGSKDKVIAYCSPGTLPVWSPSESSHVVKRMMVASAMALMLQWCAVGGAVTIVWYTPTTGLGCRSGAYLLYAINSTLIWIFMLLSSVLAHVASSDARGAEEPPRRSHNLILTFATILRWIGKTGAFLNAIWIVAACIFQFSNVFDRCYCNSSVLGRGASKAFNVLLLLPADKDNIVHAWIGGVALALCSAFIFIAFVQIYLNPPMPGKLK